MTDSDAPDGAERLPTTTALGPLVVLGAGAAGLAAAHELTLHGRPVTVLEAQDFVGGLCRTVDYKGFHFDLGGHRWFTKNEDLDNWFHRLLGAELVAVNRISRVHFNGRYFLYPIEFTDLVQRLGLGFMLDAGLKFVWAAAAARLRARPPVDMAQAYIAQFGPRLYEMFFRRYTEKVWGRPCQELSADWVAQRSKGLSVWSLVKEAFGANSRDVDSLIDRFYYPSTGYGRLPGRLCEDVRLQGGEVRLSTPVRRVHCHGPDDFEVFYQDGDSQCSLRTPTVLSTLPLGRLVQMLTPSCPPEVVAAAQGLAFRDLVTVNLIVARERVSNDTWIYVQDEDVLFGRLHEPKNWSAAMVPDPSRTSLVLECFCSRGDALWSMDDGAIVRRCVEDLERRLGLLRPGEVQDSMVVRTTNAYPVYDLKYAAKVDTIRRHLETLPGLHILGRSGSFRYNNADHSVEMGLMLGRRMMGAALDHLAVNTETEYQETRATHPATPRDRFTMVSQSSIEPLRGKA